MSDWTRGWDNSICRVASKLDESLGKLNLRVNAISTSCQINNVELENCKVVVNDYAKATSSSIEKMRKDIQLHVDNTVKIARLAEELAGEIADGEDSDPDHDAKKAKRFSKFKHPTVEQAQYLKRRERK